jgi:hypothetical protein
MTLVKTLKTLNTSDDIAFTGKTFGELYNKTKEKISGIEETGYKLIQQWAHHTKDGQEILFEDDTI